MDSRGGRPVESKDASAWGVPDCLLLTGSCKAFRTMKRQAIQLVRIGYGD